MTPSKVLLAAALSCFGACATTHGDSSFANPAAMVAAADALDQRFLDAANKGDVESVMDTYWHSPELLSIGLQGTGDRGWEATRTTWAETFKAMPGVRIEFPTKRNEARGGVVLGSGTFKLSVPTGGAPVVIEGRYSDVKAMRDGKWVYLMDHASAPMPAAK